MQGRLLDKLMKRSSVDEEAKCSYELLEVEDRLISVPTSLHSLGMDMAPSEWASCRWPEVVSGLYPRPTSSDIHFILS